MNYLADATLMDQILTLQHEVAKLPQINLVPRHIFLPGIYIRELAMPAGACFVGSVHLHDHASFVDGDITVVSKDGQQRYTGSAMVIATAGTKRAVVTHAPTVWRTVHPNPTEERDLAKLEALFVVPETIEDALAYKPQEAIA